MNPCSLAPTRRVLSLLPLLGFALLASCSSPAQEVAIIPGYESAPSTTALERATMTKINDFRQNQGRGPLTLNSDLATLARAHSQEMARVGRLSHRGFGKRGFEARQRLAIGNLVENVQSSQGFQPTGKSITNQWIHSRKHRQNMLVKSRQGGVGVVKNGNQIYSTLLIGG